eukprot:912757-Rhodomonas_salina.1
MRGANIQYEACPDTIKLENNSRSSVHQAWAGRIVRTRRDEGAVFTDGEEFWLRLQASTGGLGAPENLSNAFIHASAPCQ